MRCAHHYRDNENAYVHVNGKTCWKKKLTGGWFIRQATMWSGTQWSERGEDQGVMHWGWGWCDITRIDSRSGCFQKWSRHPGKRPFWTFSFNGSFPKIISENVQNEKWWSDKFIVRVFTGLNSAVCTHQDVISLFGTQILSHIFLLVCSFTHLPFIET